MYSKCHWRLAWYSYVIFQSILMDRFKPSFEAPWYSSVPNSLIRMAWLLLGPVCLCTDYTRTFTMSVVAKYQLPTYCQLNVYRKESFQAGICREGREVADFLGRSPLQFGVATHWSKRSVGSSQSQDETKQKCSFLGCVVIRKINRTLFIIEWVYDMIYVGQVLPANIWKFKKHPLWNILSFAANSYNPMKSMICFMSRVCLEIKMTWSKGIPPKADWNTHLCLPHLHICLLELTETFFKHCFQACSAR